MAVKIITKDTFEETINCGKTVLVDFFATWCGPCKMLAPIIEELAKEYEGKVKVGKVNIDEEPGLAQQFRVMSIPTLLLFENGKVVANSVGAVPKHQVEAMLK